ncbi:hypothetical protein QC761_503440 [Podospora bellae-mahoneyi]|uniref:Uncharacterized protein n=1 Tax=Podospora bellae-mahoneyi TaxID=2093777 RepID=A0ABR0FDL0_9PEZI|nr:hypothetical protein QC761_503440 [Podospora bellae-mahoneyi]
MALTWEWAANVRCSHFGPRIDSFDGSMALACPYQTSGTSPSSPVFGSARVPDVLRVTSGWAVAPFFLERLYLPGSGLEFSGRRGPDTPLGARLLTEGQRVEQVVASDGKSPENIFMFATCKRTPIPASWTGTGLWAAAVLPLLLCVSPLLHSSTTNINVVIAPNTQNLPRDAAAISIERRDTAAIPDARRGLAHTNPLKLTPHEPLLCEEPVEGSSPDLSRRSEGLSKRRDGPLYCHDGPCIDNTAAAPTMSAALALISAGRAVVPIATRGPCAASPASLLRCLAE